MATKPSGRRPARSSRRVSSMPSVWWARRPLERIDDQELPVAAREGLDQHLTGVSGITETLGRCRTQPLAAPGSGNAAQCRCGSASMLRTLLGQVAWRVETCRRHRPGPGGIERSKACARPAHSVSLHDPRSAPPRRQNSEGVARRVSMFDERTPPTPPAHGLRTADAACRALWRERRLDQADR